MNKRNLLCFAAVSLLAAPWSLCGTFSFDGKTDKPPVSYEPGEKMVFSVQLEEDGKPVSGKKLSWKRTGDDGKTQTGEGVSSGAPFLVETSLDKPGFVHLQVSALDHAGKALVNPDKKNVVFDGGAGVHPQELQSIPEPADFDAYWQRQKAELDQVPVKAGEMVSMPEKDAKVSTWDVKIDCAGGKPVSGYFSKTKGAEPKSAGAHVIFVGYGVTSAPRQDQLAADPKKPMLVLAINAHGIENGKDAGFYDQLKKTTLKGYAFDKEQNSKPETAYFNGMVFRLRRALEFIKAQPEWDGKTLIVSGGSQGGFQSLIAAGLDHDVSQCNVAKPWCCDLGGITLGRIKGWRPDYTEALGYFDPVNHARRIQCPVSIVAGLGDPICPPSGEAVLYNNLKVSKKITYIQGATHGFNPPHPQTQTVSAQ